MAHAGLDFIVPSNLLLLTKSSKMPKLPQVKWKRLGDVRKGSLVTVQDPNGKLLGFRVGLKGNEDDPEQPAFVTLAAANDGGITATLARINANTRVLDHSDLWSIHVDPLDWDARAQTRTFAAHESGWLLLSGDELGLLVAGGTTTYAGYLTLKDGMLQNASAEEFVVAKKWKLYTSGVDGESELLLPRKVQYLQQPNP